MRRRLVCESSSEDRISKLPDELIHHIFSFIDTVYAVRACVLSKRWRYIWTSLPTLSFNSSVERVHMCNWSTCKVVDKVINLRNNEVYDIQRFHLVSKRYPLRAMTTHLGRWLLAAVRANVRDIDIDIVTYCGYLRYPQCIFTCRTLNKLSLNLHKRIINLHNSIDLPSLLYLKLDYLSCNNGRGLITKFLLGCPILKHLDFNISGSSAKLNIHSSTLEHLAICGDGRIKLSLDAPNLVSLFSVVCLGDVPFVVSAHIDTKSAHEDYRWKHRLTNTSKPAASMYPKAYPEYMLKCLKALRNVTDLTLSAPPLLQGKSGVPEFLENELPQFCNLRRLKLLQTRFSNDSIYVMALKLLKNSPNVESLSLEQYEELLIYQGSDLFESESSSDDSSDDSDSSLEPSHDSSLEQSHYSSYDSDSSLEQSHSIQDSYINEMTSDDYIERLSSTFTLSNLKFVEIFNLRGSDVELKFIEVLLRKADVLEKLYLIHESGERRKEIKVDSCEICKRFWDKVAAFPKASSSIEFHMRDSSSLNIRKYWFYC